MNFTEKEMKSQDVIPDENEAYLLIWNYVVKYVIAALGLLFSVFYFIIGFYVKYTSK